MTCRTHRPLSVLVVEDRPDDRALARALLERGGDAKVVTASSAAVGLQLLRSGFRPDVALVDLRMQGLSGWDFARIVRAEGLSAAKLVAYSAYADTYSAAELAEGGFDAVLAKPVDSERFAASVRALAA